MKSSSSICCFENWVSGGCRRTLYPIIKPNVGEQNWFFCSNIRMRAMSQQDHSRCSDLYWQLWQAGSVPRRQASMILDYKKLISSCDKCCIFSDSYVEKKFKHSCIYCRTFFQVKIFFIFTVHEKLTSWMVLEYFTDFIIFASWNHFHRALLPSIQYAIETFLHF